MTQVALALDMHTLNEARDLLNKVRDSIHMIKIGPELWANYGPEALELGDNFNIPIFLDLKLHDIPNTVARTIDVLLNRIDAQHDVRFLTVHCFGGREMLKTAFNAAANSPLNIVAVTLLTSLNSEDMREMGMKRQAGLRTVEMAMLAKASGIENFVTSPIHIELLRKSIDRAGFKSTLFCPGIRSSSAPEDDQKRVKPVSFAVKAGADWLVIGRPITQSADPASAARDILEQIKKATP